MGTRYAAAHFHAAPVAPDGCHADAGDRLAAHEDLAVHRFRYPIVDHWVGGGGFDDDVTVTAVTGTPADETVLEQPASGNAHHVRWVDAVAGGVALMDVAGRDHGVASGGETQQGRAQGERGAMA